MWCMKMWVMQHVAPKELTVGRLQPPTLRYIICYKHAIAGMIRGEWNSIIVINIRAAQSADIETLFQIRTSVVENYQSREELASLGITPQTIADMLQSHCCAWIAEIHSEPIAFAMADVAERSIFALFVLPDFEGRGAGRRLMEQAEAWLWSQGPDPIWLLTGNDPALRAYGFYQHLGWTPVGVAADGQIKLIKSTQNQ